MTLLPKILPRTNDQRQADIERDYLRMEAKIGAEILGPLPKGHSRQFFCLDEHTWIWHETWKDSHGQFHDITTRYYVRPNGILKSQDGSAYQPLSREEMQNLSRTTDLYAQRVGAAYQKILQSA